MCSVRASCLMIKYGCTALNQFCLLLLGSFLWFAWKPLIGLISNIADSLWVWPVLNNCCMGLTHWGRVRHICVSKITIIGSDKGLSPGWRQAIIWNSAGILLIRPLGTNFSEILIGVKTFSFTNKELKMSSAKWCPFCLGLNGSIHTVS